MPITRRLTNAALRAGRSPAGWYGYDGRSPGETVPTGARGRVAFTSPRLLHQGPGVSSPTRPARTLYQNAMAGQYGASAGATNSAGAGAGL